MLAEAQDKAENKDQPASSIQENKIWFLELTGLFLLALLIRCAFNFWIPHVNNFAACDAFEYINNGQALMQLAAQPANFWQTCITVLTGNADAESLKLVKEGLAPLKDFYISGPVYPAVLALNIVAFGGTVGNVHNVWPALLFGNSAVSALTCVFISLIGREAFDKREGRIAGLIAALYPGFIVNSGRLYSETFACFLLSALVYLTVRGFRERGNNLVLVFLSGFLAAALQLTRSVMSVLSLALIPVTAIQQHGRKKLIFLLPFALGFTLIAAPWLAFQKLAFGGGGLVVDRVGHYNFFIGNNVDTQGWLSYPYPDGRNVEATSFPQLFTTAFKKSPARWVRLMLDKPLRLFKYPWNDFRTPIGVFDFRSQVIFHECILFLSCLGLALCTFLSSGRKPYKRQLCSRVFLAGLFAFHCIYYLFITVPRYNLTSIPEMILFAAAALGTISRAWQEKKTRSTSLFLSLSCIVLFCQLRLMVVGNQAIETAIIINAIVRLVFFAGFLFFCIKLVKQTEGYRKIALAFTAALALALTPLIALPLRANGRYQEWHDYLKPGERAQQIIHLPRTELKKAIYLLIDSEGVKQTSDGIELSVNGQNLEGPFLPSMAFAEDFDRFLDLGNNSVQREGERMWDSLTNSADCGNLDLRQWSMIAIPPAVLEKAAHQSESDQTKDIELNVQIKNTGKQALPIYGSYDTGSKERILPSIASYSWEKVFYGVENDAGLTDTRYDIKVPASTLVTRSPEIRKEGPAESGVINLALLVAPPVPEDVQDKESSSQNLPLGSTQNKIPAKTLPSVKHNAVSWTEIASFDLPPFLQVSKKSGSDFSIKLATLPGSKEHSSNAAIDMKSAGESEVSADTVWLFDVKGTSKVTAGTACPAADLITTYRKQDGTSYTYKSSFSPRRLPRGENGEKVPFEFVVPIKPIVQGARVELATLNLHLTTRESQYLNIQKQPEGSIDFESRIRVLSLPTNPIGLGHQVL